MSTKKKVWQYKCDFCGKKKYSKSAINLHEKHCTMNHKRECRHCIQLKGESQTDIIKLKSIVPIRDDYRRFYDNGLFDHSYEDKCDSCIDELMEKTEGCPVCVYSILRQSGQLIHINFNYKKLIEEFWENVNESRLP